jgi:hypothetical protein
MVKGTPAEEFLKVLNDPGVVEALSKIMEAVMVKTLVPRIVALEKSVETLTDDTILLRQRAIAAEDRIADLEASARIDVLTIKGIPTGSFADGATPSAGGDGTGTSGSSVEAQHAVQKFCQEKLGVTVGDHDISAAYRVKAGLKDGGIRPITVRFNNRRVRDAVYGARRVLKNTSFFISEHLTPEIASMFYEARKLVKDGKLSSAWTQNCRVYVKHSTSRDEKPSLVRYLKDITN